MDMEEINLRDLLIYFRKHLVLFFAMVVFCVSAGTAYTILVQKPEYKSRATIILSSDKSKTTVQSEITANKNLIDTYTEVVKSHRVLDRVISENNLAESFEALSAKINVSSLKNTEIISISVVDANAYRSYEVANWVADIFKEEISQIYNDTSVNILDHAVEPKSPYNVDVVKQEIIYMVAGMVLGAGMILLPILGAWTLVREVLFGARIQRMAQELAASGELAEDTLPRTPAGRVDREAAAVEFESFAAAVEQEPNSWKAWFNLACMYDAGGERKRARAAMRNAWALRSGGQAKGMR